MLSPAQVTEALRRAGYNRTATGQDITNASRFGLAIFGRNRAGGATQLGRQVGAPLRGPSTTSPDDLTRGFIDQLRPLFTRETTPEVKPFEESGFYDEADAKRLADLEYDPYYQKQRQDQEGTDQESERQRLEEVNASGGLRSSAYGREQDLRRTALQRAQQEQDTQKRLAKEQFSQSRRGEAYQRYLRSIGALAM